MYVQFEFIVYKRIKWADKNSRDHWHTRQTRAYMRLRLKLVLSLSGNKLQVQSKLCLCECCDISANGIQTCVEEWQKWQTKNNQMKKKMKKKKKLLQEKAISRCETGWKAKNSDNNASNNNWQQERSKKNDRKKENVQNKSLTQIFTDTSTQSERSEWNEMKNCCISFHFHRHSQVKWA